MSENINKLKDLFLSFSKEKQVTITYTAAADAESLQSCPTLCNPIDGTGMGCHFLLQGMKVKSESEVEVMSDSATPWTAAHQGSSIRGIFQASVLEWGAIAFSDD